MREITVIKIGGRAASDTEMVLELGREILRDAAETAPGQSGSCAGRSSPGGESGSRAGRSSPEGESGSRAGRSSPDEESDSRAGGYVVVHGGGSELSTLMERYGYTPRFVDGVRRTSPEEMPLVDMALAGRMNTALVRLFGKVGLNPVGLSAQDGGMVLGAPVVMADGRAGRTGRPVAADGTVLRTLLRAGYTPVVSPVSRDETWEGLNINADEVALALAEALEASRLIFLSDIPGILDGNQVIEQLTHREAERAIETGILSGGMIPKVRSSLFALEKGVGSITIGEYKEPGDLGALAAGRKGTVLIYE